MAKLALTTVATTQLKVATRGLQMILQRCQEHVTLAKQMKDMKQRQGRLKTEIEDLFLKEKQGAALANGTKLDGYGIKMVYGTTKKFDRVGFMKKHGLSEEDFAEFTEEVPKESYIKITAPGEKDGGDD